MSEVVSNQLPDGWIMQPIKHLGIAMTGNTPPTKDPANYGGNIPFIKPTELVDQPVSVGRDTITEKGAEKARILPKDGVLVSCIGNLGKTAIAKRDVAFNQQINAIVFNEAVIPEYGFYYFQTAKFRKDLESLASATTISIVNKSKFESINVPIAPPEQQKRIVAKIEELFSHIDAGIEALKKAKQLLKQYRQSVLKDAVTGELTKQWREENKDKLEPASQLLERILKERRKKWEEQQLDQFKSKGKMPKDDKWKDKYKEPALPNTKELSYIPTKWQWVELQHVFDVITDGDHQAPPKTDKGIPFLVIGNVNKGRINFSDTRHVPQDYYDDLAEIRKPRKGDLLFTVVGSYGIPVKVNSDIEFCVQRHIAILKPSPHVSLDYLFHLLSSGFVYKQATDVATGTAQKTVPLGGLRQIKIPLCSIEEQQELVRIVNQRIDAISRLQEEISTQLFKSEKNKQSILFSAFAGKLVGGLTDDGDAKTLLENIKLVREKTSKTVGRSAKKAKSQQKSQKQRKDLMSLIHERFGTNSFTIEKFLSESQIDDFGLLKSELFGLLKSSTKGRYRLDMQFDEKDEQYIFRLIERSTS